MQSASPMLGSQLFIPDRSLYTCSWTFISISQNQEFQSPDLTTRSGHFSGLKDQHADTTLSTEIIPLDRVTAGHYR